jgi:hypothetical protein
MLGFVPQPNLPTSGGLLFWPVSINYSLAAKKDYDLSNKPR